MDENIRDETITKIRGCLISVKGRVDLRLLCKDYRQLMGAAIPYEQIGYNSLEEFLRSVPSLSITRAANGQVLVDARPSEKSSHISEMVDRQKTAQKKFKFKKFTTYTPPHLQTEAPNMWRPKNVKTNWNNSYVQDTSKSNFVSHKQFVKLSPRKEPFTQIKPKTTKPVLTPINNNTLTKDNHQEKPPPLKPRLSREISLEADGSEKSPHSSRTNRSSIMSSLLTPTSPTGNMVTPTSPLGNTVTPTNPIVTPKSPVGSENVVKTGKSSMNGNAMSLRKKSASENGAVSQSRKVEVPKEQEISFKPTGDAVVDLHSFSMFQKIEEPIYTVMQRQAKPYKPIFHDCKVKVDGNSVSSYPKDFREEMGAKYYASQLALDQLIAKYGLSRRQSMLLSNEKDVLERIPPLVQKHFTGVWSWQVEADYKDLYNEQLPINWLEIVDRSACISMELFGQKCVLQYCSPDDRFQKGKLPSIPLSYDISIPTSTVQFNEQGVLLAQITCAMSAKEIWCRQVQTPESQAFNSMAVDMEAWYNQNYANSAATDVQCGSFYAASLDNAWHRVRVLEVTGDEVQCLLVDSGDDQVVPKQNLFKLMRQFAKEPAQAFICRLAGLEELYEVSIGSEHVHNLEGKLVQLENCVESDNENYEPICVAMYDIATKNVINEELMSLISIDNALPVLEDNVPKEVYASNVEANGDIYLQIRTTGYEKLLTLLAELETSILEKSIKLPTETVTPIKSQGRLYFIKTPEDEHYSRVRIIDWHPSGSHVQIYYVDKGNACVIKLQDSTLYPLNQLSSVINLYPEQALKVQLEIDEVPEDFVEKVRSLVPDNSPALCMVNSRDDTGVARVRMFVRVPSQGLIPVNEKVCTGDKKKSRDVKLERLISLDNVMKGVPSSGNLKSPPLPDVGSYFDVNIPCAVNPWNFFVQPYETFEKLKTLMINLQERYADNAYSPLAIDDIKPGLIYATKYEGNWYRTSVIKVIHSSSISVFYCDYGYYANLKLAQLVPLDPEFLELPFQAIKAKLSGIKPRQDKWTMEDCKVFQKQVCKKTFVSILRSVEKDELYKCDNVLELLLIDTSTDKDIYIEDVLVQQLIAVKINKT